MLRIRQLNLVLVLCLATGCAYRADHDAAVLLFDGRGTSPGDVAAVESVLDSMGVRYSTAGAWRLNRMSEAQLRRYRLLIVPGGNFIQIGNSLSPTSSANIRGAIQNGLNYLGICAGAFFAGNSSPNGLNLTSGVRFGFYSAEAQGIRKAALAIHQAGGGPVLDQYWEDGPQLSGWGEVVARYPDGTPAVVQGRVGTGWVVLSGFHPEAPQSWRRGMTFRTSESDDHAYAAMLIDAALNGKQLAHD